MIVTFIGHADICATDDLKSRIAEVVENCIKNGADIFYCGHYGKFDCACAYAVKNLKIKYPFIKLFFITPYIGGNYGKNLKYIRERGLYDDIIYPGLETVPLKFAISKRNEWMAERADVVVAYVGRDFGGAYATYRYAVRKGKKIFNLYGGFSDPI